MTDDRALTPPPPDTVERWLWDFVTTTDAELKLRPPERPGAWERTPPVRVLSAPGRPPGWCLLDKAPKRVKPGALEHARRRCQLFHTFLHHELQAAELMAWALLAFPETPAAFRRGLLSILEDELRHLKLYREYLHDHGVRFGDFPLRDWFWTRVPQSQHPAEFVAVMGLGFEGGNLDHAERFARWFRDAGDAHGADILERVCAEEERHVRFAARWFRELTGGLSFEAWRAHLPEPLTPTMMRGHALNRPARERAGFDATFLDRLAEWS